MLGQKLPDSILSALPSQDAQLNSVKLSGSPGSMLGQTYIVACDEVLYVFTAGSLMDSPKPFPIKGLPTLDTAGWRPKLVLQPVSGGPLELEFSSFEKSDVEAVLAQVGGTSSAVAATQPAPQSFAATAPQQQTALPNASALPLTAPYESKASTASPFEASPSFTQAILEPAPAWEAPAASPTLEVMSAGPQAKASAPATVELLTEDDVADLDENALTAFENDDLCEALEFVRRLRDGDPDFDRRDDHAVMVRALELVDSDRDLEALLELDEYCGVLELEQPLAAHLAERLERAGELLAAFRGYDIGEKDDVARLRQVLGLDAASASDALEALRAKYFEAQSRREPNSVWVRGGHASALYLAERYAEAEAELRWVCTQPDARYPHFAMLSELLLELERPDDALEVVQAARGRFPQRGGAMADLGQHFIDLGDVGKGVELLQKSVEIEPRQDTMTDLALQLHRLERWEALGALCAKALATPGVEPEYWRGEIRRLNAIAAPQREDAHLSASLGRPAPAPLRAPNVDALATARRRGVRIVFIVIFVWLFIRYSGFDLLKQFLQMLE